MLQATEQQHAMVSRKVQRLEGVVQTQMEQLKALRQQRNDALKDVETLRAQLEAAEAVADRVSKEHDEVQRALKLTAEEFSSAQLLQKKYLNAVQLLQGHCRSFIRMAAVDRTQQFIVADECTVNALDRKKSFVVDGVFQPDELPVGTAASSAALESAMQLSGTVTDVLSGINVAMLTFGPQKSGKTSFLFGAAAADTMQQRPQRPSSVASSPSSTAATGVFEQFVVQLFDNLEANEVTHFNIRCTFAELNQEHLVDLLSEYGGVSAVLGYRGGGVMGGQQQTLSDMCSVQVQTAADVMQLLHSGLHRIAQSRSRSAASATWASASHLLFHMVVENFNVKGNFRRATALFVDLAGQPSSSPGVGGLPSAASPDHVWVHKSMTAVCDVISMLSAANQQHLQATGLPIAVPVLDVPHRHHRLVQLIRDTMGGNCKTSMLCCVDCRANSPDEIVSALSYAYYFKSIRNFPVPYDIPPELQRLNMQMNRLREEMDDDDGHH